MSERQREIGRQWAIEQMRGKNEVSRQRERKRQRIGMCILTAQDRKEATLNDCQQIITVSTFI